MKKKSLAIIISTAIIIGGGAVGCGSYVGYKQSQRAENNIALVNDLVNKGNIKEAQIELLNIPENNSQYDILNDKIQNDANFNNAIKLIKIDISNNNLSEAKSMISKLEKEAELNSYQKEQLQEVNNLMAGKKEGTESENTSKKTPAQASLENNHENNLSNGKSQSINNSQNNQSINTATEENKNNPNEEANNKVAPATIIKYLNNYLAQYNAVAITIPPKEMSVLEESLTEPAITMAEVQEVNKLAKEYGDKRLYLITAEPMWQTRGIYTGKPAYTVGVNSVQSLINGQAKCEIAMVCTDGQIYTAKEVYSLIKGAPISEPNNILIEHNPYLIPIQNLPTPISEYAKTIEAQYKNINDNDNKSNITNNS